MGDLVPRKDLVKQGMKGIGGILGGGALLILSGLSGLGGAIVGGILTIGGLAIASSKEDRVAGTVAAGAGILTLVASLIPGIGSVASWLMSAGGIGLLVAGGFSLFKFIANLRKRN